MCAWFAISRGVCVSAVCPSGPLEMLLALGQEPVESAGVLKNSQINIWPFLKWHPTHFRERLEALGLACVRGSDYQVVRICKVYHMWGGNLIF